MALYGLTKNIEVPLEVNTSTVCEGRGVFAVDDIPCNSYICEYQGDVINFREMKERQNEYAINEEGCFIFEAKKPDGSFIAIDATRHFTSVGRLINHSNKGNCRPIGPLLVRGKWRIALVSIKDIKSKEEVLYNYGDTTSKIPWLKKSNVHYILTYTCKIRCNTREFIT